MADKTAGAKWRKKKKSKKDPITVPDDACTTCSVCRSKLVMFSGINKYNLGDYLHTGKVFASSNLQCSACGSSLCHLSDLSKT